ncbi:MAG: MFS transporter [Blastopirellula sp.]|nr:MAG: MFS transporter [Blastopirellula sp.]
MDLQSKATRIRLFDFSTPQMRAFHMSWFAFFLCFFAWFGIAPLMGAVEEEMGLNSDQIGWCIIGSVAITVLARLLVGWLCDRIGPRICYSVLLVFGSIPVMGIGLAQNFETFLLFRVLIGAIGASFVITQYHTSQMFAPNCVGTANATTAGWGNMGGGATQFAMPLLFGLLIGVFGFSDYMGWRVAMMLAGAVCALTGVAYYFLTQDTPEGNFADLRAQGKMPASKKSSGSFMDACKDYRVWVLFIIYGGCFGLELTMNNVAARYFAKNFDYLKDMDPLKAMWIAGLFASAYGLTNVFARTIGGGVGDKFGEKWGLSGRVKWLFLVLFCEGLALMLFSQMTVLILAVPAMIVFGIFVQMASGATYSVVPFVNKKSLGSVAGIVGAGGNACAVAAGFLFKTGVEEWATSLFILGALVTACSFLSFAVTFSSEAEYEAEDATQKALATRELELELASAA